MQLQYQAYANIPKHDLTRPSLYVYPYFRPAKKWYESDFVDNVFKEGGKKDPSRLVEDIIKMVHINN